MIEEDKINALVEKVVEQISSQKKSYKTESTFTFEDKTYDYSLGTFKTIDMAINASQTAFKQFQDVSLAQRKQIIRAIRQICQSKINKIEKYLNN